MPKLPGVACQHQTPEAPERRPVALVLIAIVTLVLSTLIAATAVSIGLARAGGPCPVAATQVALDAATASEARIGASSEGAALSGQKATNPPLANLRLSTGPQDLWRASCSSRLLATNCASAAKKASTFISRALR